MCKSSNNVLMTLSTLQYMYTGYRKDLKCYMRNLKVVNTHIVMWLQILWSSI